MARQLTFDLPVRTARGRGDFYISPANASAVHLIDSDWPGGRMVLIGPAGSGKSHLAQVWADDHGANIVEATELAGSLEHWLTQAEGPLVVENVHDVAGNTAKEEALFHLLNAQAGQGGRLLLTSGIETSAMGLTLPDLASRLEGSVSARLDAPDDALLAALFVKHFADRQLDVSPDLIAFLVARAERSFDGVRMIVDKLDAISLAERKPVTRRMAARLLDNPGGIDA